jgi:hypothetical protein
VTEVEITLPANFDAGDETVTSPSLDRFRPWRKELLCEAKRRRSGSGRRPRGFGMETR